MKIQIKLFTTVLLVMCIALITACGQDGAAGVAADGVEVDAAAPEQDAGTAAAEATGNPTFNPTGFPIMSEPITFTAFIEGGTGVDWEANLFLQEFGELTNVFFDIQPAPSGSDGLARRNLLLASGDYPDVFFTGWGTMFTKSDVMQFGAREGIIVPVTRFVEDYGINMQRVFAHNPNFRISATAPDGEIYGVPRFSECFHCQAYPKIYMRQDWLDILNLDMPTTTEEFRNVLRAFVDDDPAGIGSENVVGLMGATTWNTMVEFALMGMSFQTVVPDFWLSYCRDFRDIVISPMTDYYREGLRYIRSLYEEGLIDRASFTQPDDQMAQAVRTYPFSVGAFVVDHPAMGFYLGNEDESRNYQIMLPLAGPDGFRKQGDNANEGEVGGFHAVITDIAQFPEAAFRFIDAIMMDDEINMQRFHGRRGLGWDFAPEGTRDVFGNPARFVVLDMDSVERSEMLDLYGFGAGPQADLAPFRLSMLPEVENIYLPGSYEQRITLDTVPLLPFRPDVRLERNIFVPLEMLSEFSEIQANLNSFFRMTTVQFIIGDRCIETEWDQFINEAERFNVHRYVEIYKIATGRN